ncbi:MAG: cupin domain-containing protein, partial [Gaiellaceae bacterium]
MSFYSELRRIEPLQIWEGVVARTVGGAEATLAAIELDPGTVVPEHAHQNEQTGILIRGQLTFTIGGETKALRPGAAWVIPAHTPHSVEAGPQGASLVELFAPPRADWGGLDRL